MSGNQLKYPSEHDVVILLYHGVTRVKSRGIENFSRKHMPAAEFDEQIAWLARCANPMSLREIAVRLSRGETLPPRSVAITFDDAYRNQAEVGLPILKRHRVPATFFITTGFVGTNRLFWTDKVEHYIGCTAQRDIVLNVPGLCNNSMQQRWKIATDEDKIRAVIEIKTALKALHPHDRDSVLAKLSEVCGVDDERECRGNVEVENYRTLEWDHVRAMDSGRDYEVGGHSVNHEILAYLKPDKLRYEIVHCIDTLREKLGHPIDLFSYPEGQAPHFNELVIAQLRSAGVTICPSAIHGYNRAGDQPFYLRRVMVGFMGTRFPWRLESFATE